MSRVYFHTPSGTAEILGSEKAWLGQVAAGPGMYAWDLDRAGANCSRAYTLLELFPEPPADPFGGNYLHKYMRESKAEDARYDAACKAYNELGLSDRRYALHAHPNFNPAPGRRLIDALRTALRVDGFLLQVGDYQLRTDNLTLNTALVAGSDVVAFAAKVDGWCEVHAFVEGRDRAWLAGLIEQGLAAGIYRRGLWYPNADGSRDQWVRQGWEELIPFLRESDDEPVVMSHSVGRQFPNQKVADWEPPVLPDDWRPSWAGDEEGAVEWGEFSDADKDSYRREAALEAWCELPDGERWERALRGLREKQPWARISPETLHTVGFGPLVTVYDLYAEDRDERIAAAFTSEGEQEETLALTGK